MNKKSEGAPRPKKSFGQHFLTDTNFLRKIVRTARVEAGEAVLEIGPGRGALTSALLEAGARVYAIEADRELVPVLKERFAGDERLTLIEADAMGVSFEDIARKAGGRLKCVSNLPYNVSGPLVAKFIEEREAFTLLVLMFQKEVAQRLTASPGTRDYGSLSVMVQAYMDARMEFGVGAHLFTPRPRVASAVVSLRVLQSPRVEVYGGHAFKKTVRAAFTTRRKTIQNSLASLGAGREAVEEALSAAGIDPKRRGETLNLEEFSALTRELMGRGIVGNAPDIGS